MGERGILANFLHTHIADHQLSKMNQFFSQLIAYYRNQNVALKQNLKVSRI